MIYIITFYSHFGAIRYKRNLEKENIIGRIMPVPRNLSSSCGTCVEAVDNYLQPCGVLVEEVEQIVKVTENGYEALYRAEDM